VHWNRQREVSSFSGLFGKPAGYISFDCRRWTGEVLTNRCTGAFKRVLNLNKTKNNDRYGGYHLVKKAFRRGYLYKYLLPRKTANSVSENKGEEEGKRNCRQGENARQS